MPQNILKPDLPLELLPTNQQLMASEVSKVHRILQNKQVFPVSDYPSSTYDMFSVWLHDVRQFMTSCVVVVVAGHLVTWYHTSYVL